MRRLGIVVSIVLLLSMVGGVGYLGARSVQSDAAPVVQAPTTVEVNRGDVQQTVTAPGRLENSQQVILAPEVGGRLAKVYVRPGDPAKAGAVLARLDPVPLEEGVSSAQAELDLTLARLEKLKAGPSDAELASAHLDLLSAESRLNQLQAGPEAADVATARASVAEAKGELKRLEALPDPDAVAQAQVEFERTTVALQQAQGAYDQIRDYPNVAMMPQALALQQATIGYDAALAALDRARRTAIPAQLEVARARFASAQAVLEKVEAGPSAGELAVAELQEKVAQVALEQLTACPDAVAVKQAEVAVKTAKLALEHARAGLEAATLVAPFDGVVLEVAARPGETVMAGAALIRFADPAALEVRASVVEEDLPLVRAGQPAALFFDAQPDAEVNGHIDRIVPQRTAGDRPLYPVYIATGDLPAGLVDGMTADASIIIASRSDVLRLPRAVVRVRGDGTARVQIWTGSRTEERQVQVGLRGDRYVEIVGGLEAGEQVVAQ